MIDNKLISQHSEMTKEERAFILQTIQTHKPKKILEVGIAAGSNSAIILDFLSRNNLFSTTKLFSCDYNTTYYRDMPTYQTSSTPPYKRKSGFLVESLLPHLLPYWNLYTSGLVANHLDSIGNDIDLCIIDTVHTAPGEAMDLLMVLPYLSKNAVIILHDLSYHCLSFHRANICLLVFLALSGKKSIPAPYGNYAPMFQNIGSCVLDECSEARIQEYFRLLSITWEYMPLEVDLRVFREFIKRHYGDNFVVYFDSIVELQRQWRPKRSKLRRILSKIKRMIFCS